MPPESRQYTLVGFAVELDWRPLSFVKPIPAHRVCGVCGLVRRRTAFLPCTHTLCQSCYEQCAQDGARVCPLDGHRWDEEDVELREFPVEELLKRKAAVAEHSQWIKTTESGAKYGEFFSRFVVHCWNKESNCGEVLPASEIAQHFHRECRYHSISCPKCSAAVLCSNACKHFRSECCTSASPPGFEREGEANCREDAALLASLTRSFEGRADEIRALLERLVVGSGANSDRLSEVSHGVNNCQDALRELRSGINALKNTTGQEVAQERSEQRDILKKCLDEITALRKDMNEHSAAHSESMQIISNGMHRLDKEVKEEFAKAARENREKFSQTAGGIKEAKEEVKGIRKTADCRDEVLRDTSRQVTRCEFFVKNFESLREEALKDGWSRYEADKVYLCGYYVLPGVVVEKDERGKLALTAWFYLLKGAIDDALQWPFKQTLSLAVVHPNGGAERELREYIHGNDAACQKPGASGNYVGLGTGTSLCLDDVISDGYVKDDQIRVKFELLP